MKHNLVIALSIAAISILSIIAVVLVCLNRPAYIEDDYNIYTDKQDISTNNTEISDINNVVDEISETDEYSTILKYNPQTKDGYMNNCIFLGDSRTVAMVSYGFVSDENVLAKVGISHPAVIKYKFAQNSGKEYTVEEYLKSHPAPVVYLGFGVNGMKGKDNEAYENSYREMVDYIIEKAPESKIVIMAIWPVNDYGPYKNTCQNSWIDNINNFLLKLAEEKGIHYLDVDTILKTEDGQIKPEYDAGDGLHYRACAYTEILNYIVHHPVLGVSDDGEFKVKYVKPTGQFKSMIKEKVTLPANVEVEAGLSEADLEVDENELDEFVDIIEPDVSEEPTPEPTVEVSATPTVAVTIAPTPTPLPTEAPIVTEIVTPKPEPTLEVKDESEEDEDSLEEDMSTSSGVKPKLTPSVDEESENDEGEEQSLAE